MHFKEKYSLDTLKVCYVHIHDGRKPFGIYLKALTPLYMGSEDMQVYNLYKVLSPNCLQIVDRLISWRTEHGISLIFLHQASL